MQTYNSAAEEMMSSHMNDEFVYEGDIVVLTGRYASPINAPNTQLTVNSLVGTLSVEIKVQDKDAPKVVWAKFSDLKIVRSVTK